MMLLVALVLLLERASPLVTRTAPLEPPRHVVPSVVRPGMLSVAALDGGELGDPIGRPASNEFELNLGKAIDALRSDIPELMNRELDWSVYSPTVALVDPSGVEVQGLDRYRGIHASLRLVRQFAVDEWAVNYRLRYDWTRQTIIVQWYSRWYLRTGQLVHVDAISTFDLNARGKIQRHRIDRVIVNGHDMMAPDDLLSRILAQMHAAAQPAPVFAAAAATGAL